METVIRGLCVDPVKVLESDLHQAMKRATVRDLAEGCWQKTEYTYKGRRSSRLRVDVIFVRKRRDHLVECETRPSVKRLMEKGGRRNGLGRRTVYILVVPEERYRRLDLGRLKGYFDQVIAYDAAADEFTCSRDLRFMGSLRDAALDVLVPLHRARARARVERQGVGPPVDGGEIHHIRYVQQVKEGHEPLQTQ